MDTKLFSVRSLARLFGGALVAVLAAAPALAQDLPNWRPGKICAKDSAAGQCLLFERRAQYDVSASWLILPAVVRETCLARFTAPLEPSWRILGDCIEIEGRRAQEVAIRKREAAAEAELQRRAAARKRAREARAAAERQRVEQEEASFMALLAAQREADRKAAAARRAEAERQRVEAERQRIAAEEASFKALLEEERRAAESAAPKTSQ